MTLSEIVEHQRRSKIFHMGVEIDRKAYVAAKKRKQKLQMKAALRWWTYASTKSAKEAAKAREALFALLG